MMRVALHDAERDHMPHKTYPNLALMKISAWHKRQGDHVEWWEPLLNQTYDIVYSSKVFDFTPENPFLPQNTIRGGTGYDVKSKLPKYIDDMYPDYSIYAGCDYAIGFLTRGCNRNCPWCVVPAKEGKLRPYSTWEQVARHDTDKHDTCPIHKAELAEDHAKKAYLAKYKTMYGSIDSEKIRKVRKALRKHGKRA